MNGEKVGQGRIEVTQCCGFSATEGADVGLNSGTPVSLDYTNPFRFNGKIEKVTIDLRDDKPKAADKDTIEQKRAELESQEGIVELANANSEVGETKPRRHDGPRA